MEVLALLITFLVLPLVVLVLLDIQMSDHDRCYLNKEDTGYAVFGQCAGIEDEKGLLSEMCADCPYLESWIRKDKIND